MNSSLSSTAILKIKLSWPLKTENCPDGETYFRLETPKKQNCPVRQMS